jgi:hypothetical protein
VPLEEPQESPVPLPRARKTVAQPPDESPPSSRPILPDDLELAPASDVFPNGPSHHPE